jgi:restriction system protein
MTPPDYIDISPKEFELLVYSYLKEIGSELDGFEIQHDVKEIAADATYQIDIMATFEALGAKIKVLVECKNHKSPIKRETIQILKDRLQSIGAQKGILFATSKFQSGCIEYAEKHGIALVRMIEGKYTYETKAFGDENFEPPADLSKYVGEYAYDKTENSYTVYNIQEGWIDGLKEFILKK